MFYKYFTILVFLSSFLMAKELGFEFKGVLVKTTDPQGNRIYKVVKRNVPEECKYLPISYSIIWTGNYASSKVPDACKSVYIHTMGHLLPMNLHEDISTYGELEVLAFMKQMLTDDSMMLIDACREEWYKYRTIPGAVNMPFHHFKERKSFEFEFEHHMRELGVSINENDETLDFTEAKTILVFCNASWCSQSVAMITSLLDIGYPPEKISWYRGGIQAWLATGMTSTRK